MEQFEIAPQILELIKDKESLSIKLKEGKSLGEALGLSSQAAALLYRSARDLFTEHAYPEATKSFLFLTTIDPDNFDYWIGLGMSTQMCGDYEGGIDAYEMAAFLNVENPISYFYLSKCFFAVHDRENAKRALEMAIENSGDNPEYDSLKAQAQAALHMLEKEF